MSPFLTASIPASIPASTGAASSAFTFGPVERATVVDAIAARLRDEILSGRVAAGARLPAERELAVALGVNRLTLRAALGRLEALGLIITRQGAGTIVAAWRERAGLDALSALAGVLSPTGEPWHELLASLLEVRRILAAEAVALAARRRTAQDLKRLRALADQQQARASDPLALARGDIAFMRAVIHAARNVGLELILNTLARFPDEQPALAAALWGDGPVTLSHYPLVIGLIERGVADAARETVRVGLEVADAAIMGRVRAQYGLGAKAASRPKRAASAGSDRKPTRAPKRART